MADETKYFALASGALSQVTGKAPVPTPIGATVLTLSQYNTQVAAMDATIQAQRDANAAAEDAAKHDDYVALVTAGIPPATARRLTGYTGP